MNTEDPVRDLLRRVKRADAGAMEAARERHSTLTKPPGSLGRLEDLGVRLAGMAGIASPPVPKNPAVVVAAGDHGVLDRGVSPWPREVTAAMVSNFCAGGAAANVIAGSVGARVNVLDVGVATDIRDHPLLRRARVKAGTDDLSLGRAMNRAEAVEAVMAGAELAEKLVAGGVDLLVTGDMGIGNTTPAACLIAAFTGCFAGEVTGRGTGVDDGTLETKVEIVVEALELHRPETTDPIGTLAAVGGLEHAALVGVMIAGATHRVPVVLDGVVSNAAALVAVALSPDVSGYLIPGHLSVEPGARLALEKLGLEPLLDLDMRLGEGTGGLLAVPLVQAAAGILSEMATFEEAGIGGPD